MATLSNNKPKIALFYGDYASLIGALIRYTTKCAFVHGAVYIPDRGWFHSSESIGQYDEVNVKKYMTRRCIVFEFEGESSESLIEWHEKMIGKPYDWVGITGWALSYFDSIIKKLGNHKKFSELFNSREAFYCFEAVKDYIEELAMSDFKTKRTHISGCNIVDLFRENSALYGVEKTKAISATQRSGIFADFL